MAIDYTSLSGFTGLVTPWAGDVQRDYIKWYEFNKLAVSPALDSAAYGKPIPYSFGHRKIVGQVIWGKPVTTSASGYSVGWTDGPDGWANYGVVTYSYSATWAVSFGYTGPGTTELIRLWANATLIYDSETMALPSWLTFYSGTETQTQDPTILADKGSVTPAYRGHVYVVITDLDLTPYANQVPVITAEIGTAVNTASAMFNFMTESYTIGGNSVVLGDNLVLSTAYSPRTWYTPVIDGTSGLAHDNTIGHEWCGYDLTGDLLALLQTSASRTIYLEFDDPGADFEPFFMESSSLSATNGLYFFASSGAGGIDIDITLGGFSDSVSDNIPLGDVGKVAIALRAGSTGSVAVNGTVYAFDTGSPFPLSESSGILLGFRNAIGTHLRIFAVYGEKTDAELLALTT